MGGAVVVVLLIPGLAGLAAAAIFVLMALLWLARPFALVESGGGRTGRIYKAAHITVLYPFVPPTLLDRRIENTLLGLFRAQVVFDVDLAEIRAYLGVLYLAPDRDAGFRMLTGAVYRAFPDFPPYAGAFPSP